MFSILQKPQESVSADDLETLQNEIERRLVDVVTSKWALKRELMTLESSSPDPTGASTSIPSVNETNPSVTQAQAPNSGQSSSTTATTSTVTDTNSADDGTGSDGSQVESASVTGATIKRSHKGSSERPSKRFKPNGSNQATASSFPKRLAQCKHRSKFRSSVEESRFKNKKQITKNEAPDKLWPFVEQFCAAPTENQIKELEEMINNTDNDKEYFRIPSSGRKESPARADCSGSKAQNAKGLGALTQRLVSSLIEDYDDTDSPSAQVLPSKKKKNSKPRNAKSLDMNNAKNLEKRIRQELEEYDILDRQDEIPYTSEEDEVLRELVACQHELLTVQNQNRSYMQSLLQKAKRYLELDVEREKLREANADVIAAYQRLVQAKQKKRNPTKKERDVAVKAFKIQEAIFKKCDELYFVGIDRNN